MSNSRNYPLYLFSSLSTSLQAFNRRKVFVLVVFTALRVFHRFTLDKVLKN